MESSITGLAAELFELVNKVNNVFTRIETHLSTEECILCVKGLPEPSSEVFSRLLTFMAKALPESQIKETKFALNGYAKRAELLDNPYGEIHLDHREPSESLEQLDERLEPSELPDRPEIFNDHHESSEALSDSPREPLEDRPEELLSDSPEDLLNDHCESSETLTSFRDIYGASRPPYDRITLPIDRRVASEPLTTPLPSPDSEIEISPDPPVPKPVQDLRKDLYLLPSISNDLHCAMVQFQGNPQSFLKHHLGEDKPVKPSGGLLGAFFNLNIKCLYDLPDEKRAIFSQIWILYRRLELRNFFRLVKDLNYHTGKRWVRGGAKQLAGKIKEMDPESDPHSELKDYVARGLAYDRWAQALGGPGFLLMLPLTVTESQYTDRKYNLHFESAVKSLLDNGIKQRVSDKALDILGEKISQELWLMSNGTGLERSAKRKHTQAEADAHRIKIPRQGQPTIVETPALEVLPNEVTDSPRHHGRYQVFTDNRLTAPDPETATATDKGNEDCEDQLNDTLLDWDFDINLSLDWDQFIEDQLTEAVND